MAIRNALLGGTNWSDGEILYSLDLLDTTHQLCPSDTEIAEKSLPPIGTIIPWHKQFSANHINVIPTTISNDTLSASATTFTNNDVGLHGEVFFSRIVSAVNHTSTSYSVKRTVDLSDDNTKGYLLSAATSQVRNSWSGCPHGHSTSVFVRTRFYYVDGTNEYGSESNFGDGATSTVFRDSVNPQPNKEVWRIQEELRSSNSSGTTQSLSYMPVLSKAYKFIVTERIDSNTIKISNPVVHKISSDTLRISLYSAEYVSPAWVECTGELVEDPESPYNGQNVPQLNGTQVNNSRFLRGSSTSGVLSGQLQNHSHSPPLTTNQGNSCNLYKSSGSITSVEAVPSYFEISWVIRTK